MTAAARLATARMDQIAVGDVLNEYGLRLRVESIRPVRDPMGAGDVTVFSGQATILNPEYIDANRHLFGGIAHPGQPYTVQGIASHVVARETPGSTLAGPDCWRHTMAEAATCPACIASAVNNG